MSDNNNNINNTAIMRYFREISSIPRPSAKEGLIADYLTEFAQKRGLQYYRDEIHNVVIKKPGSPGAEFSPPVMLQGHTDMVCEKNSETSHDFDKTGISLIQDGNFLMADGTTLGADNGVAVAYMLAILDNDELVHPPLECVFTVQEEIGLKGAATLDPSVLSAWTLINLDGGPFGTAVVSCAGGMRCYMTKQVTPSVVPRAFPLHIAVRGLEGGHSGTDIHRGRGNSIKLLGRVLLRLLLEFPTMEISYIQGGAKDNTIPRESEAVAIFVSENNRLKAEKMLAELEEQISYELRQLDPSFSLEVSHADDRDLTSIGRAATYSLVNMLALSPDGVLNRSNEAGEFVISSVNFGVISTEMNKITATFSLRSSENSLQERTKDLLEAVAYTSGFATDFGDAYPGWAYNSESPIRTYFADAYRDMFNSELNIVAIHAGLECGLFSDKLPGLDAISLGPTIHDFHSPGEKLELDTFEKMYALLLEVLKRLAS